MNIYIYDDDEIVTFTLPIKKVGNFWIKDSNDKNVINVYAENNEWKINPGKNTKIYDINGNSDNLTFKGKKYYTLEKNDKKYLVLCDYLNDNTYKNFIVKNDSKITIGNSEASNIQLAFSNMLPTYITLVYKDQNWQIELSDNASCYINNKRIDKKVSNCHNCDLINIFGIKILLSNGYLFINNPFGNVKINNLEQIDLIVDDEMNDEEIENVDMYKDEDYFLKSPRIIKEISTYEMSIDSPPAQDKTQETPLWVTLAPMLTMAASSMVTLSNSIMSVVDGEKTFKSIIPSLVICISMLFTILIWPFVTKKLEKKNKINKENERQVKYQNYLNSKDKELAIEFENQKRSLEENIISTDICYDMIVNKRRSLWSRRIDQNDFLKLRVGIGSVPFDAKISYHSEDFSMDNDNLKAMLDKVIKFNKTIENVPICYSFTDNILTGINGIYPKYISFVNNLLLQAMSFHSYDDLKIVVFTNKKNENRWNYLFDSPYCFSNDKSMRFIATNTEEMQEISNYLGQLFSSRQVLSSNGNNNEKVNNFSNFNNGYYLFIIDDIDKARKMELISNILEEKRNLGFSLVILEEKLSKVPSEVNKFIVIGDKTSVILNTENNNQIKFFEEINDSYDMELCTQILANLPLHFEESQKQLPNSLTFLESCGVGKIEQLNVLNRWKDNNPTRSIKAELGVGVSGDPFILDLHEKAHGPHGLIAGMTGSGKSEFIITLVLSLALNYSPEEVAFVLIDYKGGGLTGAFIDHETGQKLPHIVGTITNLDKTEINRALASINSELRRRQEIFNEVRQKTGEGTVDIYKYQRMYRDGLLKEPMPHLIIVCDEFAELKSQQPDFMEDLITTARIGRSLGVHLILATQKPSGIVDGQIWSNSKFKICLKVQDKQDSMEMIRSDLAAELKTVGRFYMMVGYDEYFAIGQASWTGAQYYPNNEYKKYVDKNLYLIDNIASINKTILNGFSKKNMISSGEELTNIVKYLIEIGNKESNLKINQLWLDRIPFNININNLINKYNYIKKDFYLNPIIGEYDNPTYQSQGLLTLDFEKKGNTIIYGMNESGKDEILQTITYSLLQNHSTEELNMYIIDFGAEILLNFKDAPQVGNVIINGEDEKLKNLSKLLSSEIVRRKKLFSNYGGSYKMYIQSGNKIPNIVVLINSFEIVNELYADYIERLSTLIRDGNKYGIYFVITTETQNSIKMKVAQSCKNYICLQLSNNAVYRDILGKTNGLVPSNNIGRGLVKIGNVCEFQTASISDNKNSYNDIKQFIDELNNKGYKRAPRIQVMPEKIKTEIFKNLPLNINMVPLGINKETLNASLYDFNRKSVNIVSATEFVNLKLFIKNFVNEVSTISTLKSIVIDTQNFFTEFNYNMVYSNNNYNEIMDDIYDYDCSLQDTLKNNNDDYHSIEKFSNNLVIVIGFEKFFSKLDDEHKKIFKEVISHNNENAKINFVMFDIPMSYKKYEYEEWYKNSFDSNNGIWIGPGLLQQFVIKLINQPATFANITNDYAVVVTNGIPILIKTINEIKN